MQWRFPIQAIPACVLTSSFRSYSQHICPTIVHLAFALGNEKMPPEIPGL